MSLESSNEVTWGIEDEPWTPEETALLAGIAFGELDDTDYSEYLESLPMEHHSIRSLGELPPSLAWRLRYLPEADQSVFSTIRLGVLFVMAFWSGPSRLAFVQLKQALSHADPDGKLELVVVDTDGCPNLYESPEWGKGLHGAGETAWISEGRVMNTATYSPDMSVFESNTRQLLSEYGI